MNLLEVVRQVRHHLEASGRVSYRMLRTGRGSGYIIPAVRGRRDRPCLDLPLMETPTR